MPTPRKGERRKDFVARCIPQVIREGKPANVAVAQCNSVFSNRNKEEQKGNMPVEFTELEKQVDARQCFEYHRDGETMFFSGTSREFILDLSDRSQKKLLREHCSSMQHNPEVNVELHVSRAREMGIRRLKNGKWIVPDADFYLNFEKLPLEVGWYYDGKTHEFISFTTGENIPAKDGFLSATDDTTIRDVVSLPASNFFVILNGELIDRGDDIPRGSLPLRAGDQRIFAFVDESMGIGAPMGAFTFEAVDVIQAKQLARERVIRGVVKRAMLGKPMRLFQGTILFQAVERFEHVEVKPFEIA